MLPKPLKKEAEKLLETEVSSSQSIGGGSINRASKITTIKGKLYFIKWNQSAPADMFAKEKRGLNLLASAKTALRIPDAVNTGWSDGTYYILMEFIEEKTGGEEASEKFGKELAKLHKITAEQFGLKYDNYIGRLVQPNHQTDNWIDFFIEHRLKIQLKQAVDAGKLQNKTVKNFNELYKKLSDLLPEEPASLLHGDLWGGNYFFDIEGQAAIFDPAVYYGNREIEIAFTHLFGGFSLAFYEAYNQTFPLQPNFRKRKDIYNLYPLLVHTNMFGGHYGRQVEGILKRFV